MENQWIMNRRRARSRLPELASWLREISAVVNGAKFDLDVYAIFDDRVSQPPRSVAEAKGCGFQGCALGWAHLHPGFRKAGLRWPGYEPGEGALEFMHAAGDAAEFFGISARAFDCIFGGSDELWLNDGPFKADIGEELDASDPIEAAERIEQFCRDNGIPLP